MIHRDSGLTDRFEVLSDVRGLKVTRYRLSTTSEVKQLHTGGFESVAVSMKGSVRLTLSGRRQPLTLGEKDIAYIPTGEKYEARKLGDYAELILGYAPSGRHLAPFVKRFSQTRPVAAGEDGYRRRVYNMLTTKDRCTRFLGGFVEAEPGSWTSFPPHRHEGKPEVYVYYGLGKKFGLQAVLTESGDEAFAVHDGDAVTFESGYHPNVAPPSCSMNFLWLISTDPLDRNLAVEYDPAFRRLPIGPTHLQVKSTRSEGQRD